MNKQKFDEANKKKSNGILMFGQLVCDIIHESF